MNFEDATKGWINPEGEVIINEDDLLHVIELIERGIVEDTHGFMERLKSEDWDDDDLDEMMEWAEEVYKDLYEDGWARITNSGPEDRPAVDIAAKKDIINEELIRKALGAFGLSQKISKLYIDDADSSNLFRDGTLAEWQSADLSKHKSMRQSELAKMIADRRFI